jgi:DNA-binding transcriptional MerR regulator
MNVKTIARMIDISPDSVRRWSADYEDFLSATATPPSGGERKYTPHDVKVLAYISTARKTDTPHDKIREALAVMQQKNWADLPDVPQEWFSGPADGRITFADASESAQQLAQFTALQIQNQTLRQQLQEAIDRAEKFERELDHLRASDQNAQGQIHSLELQLERERATVRELQARLSAYAITGGSTPVPVALIVLVTALAVAVLVIVLLIVVRLVL